MRADAIIESALGVATPGTVGSGVFGQLTLISF